MCCILWEPTVAVSFLLWLSPNHSRAFSVSAALNGTNGCTEERKLDRRKPWKVSCCQARAGQRLPRVHFFSLHPPRSEVADRELSDFWSQTHTSCSTERTAVKPAPRSSKSRTTTGGERNYLQRSHLYFPRPRPAPPRPPGPAKEALRHPRPEALTTGMQQAGPGWVPVGRTKEMAPHTQDHGRSGSK